MHWGRIKIIKIIKYINDYQCISGFCLVVAHRLSTVWMSLLNVITSSRCCFLNVYVAYNIYSTCKNLFKDIITCYNVWYCLMQPPCLIHPHSAEDLFNRKSTKIQPRPNKSACAPPKDSFRKTCIILHHEACGPSQLLQLQHTAKLWTMGDTTKLKSLEDAWRVCESKPRHRLIMNFIFKSLWRTEKTLWLWLNLPRALHTG